MSMPYYMMRTPQIEAQLPGVDKRLYSVTLAVLYLSVDAPIFCRVERVKDNFHVIQNLK